MLSKLILAGGSGYLGNVLRHYYRDRAREIVVLTRSEAEGTSGNCRTMRWDAETPGAWIPELAGADLLINLCGKNVNCRYTPANRAEIFRSRLQPTALLGSAIAGLQQPPKLWINLASATIYRHAEDRPQDEATGEIGSGFSVEVCRAWERSFWEADTAQTRKIILRTGLVLGRNGGVFPRLKRLAAFGLDGHQGTGNQSVSWIHEQDFALITEWLFANDGTEGIYNATAPEAVSNRELMRVIRQAYGVPLGLHTPQWLLELGAWMIGTETELVLKSCWVAPKRFLDQGFRFSFPKPAGAIREILSSRS